MEIFFNELSLVPAADDNEALQCLTNLARLGRLLKEIIESLEEDSFSFRRSEDFAQQKITETQTVSEFLQSMCDFSDPVYIFLLGIFDSPYITEDDPQKTDYDLMSITIDGKDHELTGIAAACLKQSLAISLDSDSKWDTCQLTLQINRLNEKAEIVSEQKSVRHASKKQHVIDCHLPFLAALYDWSSYKPRFIPENRRQNILPLLKIYSFYIAENIDEDTDRDQIWEQFYQKLSQLQANERVGIIRKIAERIANIQKWEKATGALRENNRNRTIYTIPNSDFIISVDTQHGEFEIHRNQKGNNHAGAISFDGKRFKEKDNSRSLKL